MRSPRAAAYMRIGMEINPKVRWPFQTVVAIWTLLRSAALGCGQGTKVRTPGWREARESGGLLLRGTGSGAGGLSRRARRRCERTRRPPGGESDGCSGREKGIDRRFVLVFSPVRPDKPASKRVFEARPTGVG